LRTVIKEIVAHMADPHNELSLHLRNSRVSSRAVALLNRWATELARSDGHMFDRVGRTIE
jgi:hypothetical protein